MPTLENATLVKLGDTDQTVASEAEDVRGRAVKDSDGNGIGKVDELLVDDVERKVRFLVLEDGGFLGIGQTKSFIPVDAITKITPDEVRIARPGKHVAGAPRYDPELVKDEHEYYGNLYGYYGFAPFWTTGYLYPGYPYYPD